MLEHFVERKPLIYEECRTEKNAKMESCQSKDDKCRGKVVQIFPSEKEKQQQLRISSGNLGLILPIEKGAKSNVSTQIRQQINQPQPYPVTLQVLVDIRVHIMMS